MLRSDYSRQSDELKKQREEHQAQLAFAESMQKWYGEHWVPNAYGEGKGATKRELETTTKLRTVEQELEQAKQRLSVGGEVTFDEVGKFVNDAMAKAGYVRQEDVNKLVGEKASGVEKYVTESLLGFNHIATKAGPLAVKHYREFNEDLDVDQVVDYAVKNGINDLTKAYSAYVEPRVKERQEKELQERLKAAEEAGYKKAREEQGMNPDSMPVDSGSQTMAPFQRMVLGLKDADGGDNPQVPEGVQLGSGAIAAMAARAPKL